LFEECVCVVAGGRRGAHAGPVFAFTCYNVTHVALGTHSSKIKMGSWWLGLWNIVGAVWNMVLDVAQFWRRGAHAGPVFAFTCYNVTHVALGDWRLRLRQWYCEDKNGVLVARFVEHCWCGLEYGA
jgi:hypothetical protein